MMNGANGWLAGRALSIVVFVLAFLHVSKASEAGHFYETDLP